MTHPSVQIFFFFGKLSTEGAFIFRSHLTALHPVNSVCIFTNYIEKYFKNKKNGNYFQKTGSKDNWKLKTLSLFDFRISMHCIIVSLVNLFYILYVVYYASHTVYILTHILYVFVILCLVYPHDTAHPVLSERTLKFSDYLQHRSVIRSYTRWLQSSRVFLLCTIHRERTQKWASKINST